MAGNPIIEETGPLSRSVDCWLVFADGRIDPARAIFGRTGDAVGDLSAKSELHCWISAPPAHRTRLVEIRRLAESGELQSFEVLDVEPGSTPLGDGADAFETWRLPLRAA